MERSEWAWSREVNGYYMVDGLFLSSHTLGAVHGDEDHCRAVCTRVGGCNSISRQANSRQCLLDTACPGGDRLLLRHGSDASAARRDGSDASAARREPPGATAKAVQRRYSAVPYRSGAVTMFAVHCRPIPQWHSVPYMLAAEGAHITVVWEQSPERCKQLCAVTASCNAVRWRWWHGQAECHLKAQCTEPGSSAASQQSKAPQGSSQFVTELKWPCVDEVPFPTPGLRRSLPPDEPTGLLSFDCDARRGASRSNASGCAYLRPEVAAELAARGPGSLSRRPDVTQLRWPRLQPYAPRLQPYAPRLQPYAPRLQPHVPKVAALCGTQRPVAQVAELLRRTGRAAHQAALKARGARAAEVARGGRSHTLQRRSAPARVPAVA